MTVAASFRDRLRGGPPLLLDAAMGSELDRRGLPTTLPLWSALGLLERPELVRQIHVDNLRAGADILTTNTFRSTARTLRKAGLDAGQAAELDRLAVRLAQEARDEAGSAGTLTAGSIAPLDECYDPVFTTAPDVAFAEHRAQAQNLAAAGVDFLMIETMPTATEAAIALAAALQTGLLVTVGFVCAPLVADEPVKLLSGEPLAEAAARVAALGPAAIFVNCAAPEVLSAGLPVLRAVTDLPTGAYANAGHVDDAVGWAPDAGLTGERYARHARAWIDTGARVVGGCCGTHHGHTAALRRMLNDLAARTAPPLAS